MDELDTGWIDDSLFSDDAYVDSNGNPISSDEFEGNDTTVGSDSDGGVDANDKSAYDDDFDWTDFGQFTDAYVDSNGNPISSGQFGGNDTSIGEGIDLTQEEMDAWDAMQAARTEASDTMKSALDAMGKANEGYTKASQLVDEVKKAEEIDQLLGKPTYQLTDEELDKIDAWIASNGVTYKNPVEKIENVEAKINEIRSNAQKSYDEYSKAVDAQQAANDAAARASEAKAAAMAEWERVYEESRAAGLEEKAAKEAAAKAAQEKLEAETRNSSGTLNVSQEVASSFIEAANKNDTSTLEQMLVNGQLTPSQAITMSDKQGFPQDVKNWLYDYLYENGSLSENDYDWLTGNTNSDVNAANVMKTFGYNNKDSAATDINNVYNKGLTEKATNVVSDAMKKVVIYQPYVRKAVKKWY